MRSEAIAAIDYVDYVVVNETPTAVYPIRIIKPDIYCKGKDYKNSTDDITGEIKNEIKELKKCKGKIFLPEELTFSSSKLINNSTNFYSAEQRKNNKKIKKNKF